MRMRTGGPHASAGGAYAAGTCAGKGLFSNEQWVVPPNGSSQLLTNLSTATKYAASWARPESRGDGALLRGRFSSAPVVVDRCVEVDATARTLHLAVCSSSPQQQWTYNSASGQLISTGNMCLTAGTSTQWNNLIIGRVMAVRLTSVLVCWCAGVGTLA